MVKRIQSLFLALVQKIESDPTPISRYFLLFVAILALRLALEFFSSHRLFRLDDILHIGLWFAMIVQAFLIQLHWFSGASVNKVARLSVVGFTIALTAPIIDLLVSGGQGAKMNYLAINTWSDLAWAYISVGGSSLSRGATLGIRIEIALLVLASATYIFHQRKSWPPAILGAWSIYTVLFISGTVPKILGLIVDGMGLQYGPDDQSTLLLLLTADLLLLFLGLWRYSPQWMSAHLYRLPYGTLALGLALVGAGALLAQASYPGNWSLSPTTLFHFPLLLGAVICFGVLVVTQGQEQPNPHIRNGLAILLLLIGLAISDSVLFGLAGLWGALFLYGEAPLYLGRLILLRQLLTAAALGICVLVGFMFRGGPMVGFPSPVLLLLLASAFLIGLGLEARDASPPAATWWHAPIRLPKPILHLAFAMGILLPLAYLIALKGANGTLPAIASVIVVGTSHFSRRIPRQVLLLALACLVLFLTVTLGTT